MQPSPLPIKNFYIIPYWNSVLIGIYSFKNPIFLILFFWYWHTFSCKCTSFPLLSSNLWGKRQTPWKQKSFFVLWLPPNLPCLINIDSNVHLSHGQNYYPTDYLPIANIPLQWKDLLVTTLTNLNDQYHQRERTLCTPPDLTQFEVLNHLGSILAKMFKVNLIL